MDETQSNSLLEFFGARVREHRVAAGMTQTDLGKKIGKSKQTVAAIENATQGTTFDVVYLLATALSMAPADFFPTYNLNDDLTELDIKKDAIKVKASRLKDAHVDTVLLIMDCLGATNKG